MADSDEAWPAFEDAILRRLGEDDDPALWRAVVNAVCLDARALSRLVPEGWSVTTQLGRCSHWLRPHQTRWKADGGFAWPTGYGGRRFDRLGLPEFDWCHERRWPDGVGSGPASRGLVFRAAVPSRSRRHRQAAVHTAWSPGTPFGFHGGDVVQFYGFRREPGGVWACTAHWPRSEWLDRLYEKAAGWRHSPPRRSDS